MAQSVYITSGDYAVFGLDSTSGPAVAQASDIINGYLRRPEGLIWQSDATGQPAIMLGSDSSLSLTAASSFGPGSNITLAVESGVGSGLIGEPIMIDRGLSSICEMSVVVGVDISSRTVTVSQLQFQHAAGSSLELGLTIAETCPLPSGRPIARLSRMPIVRLVAGARRYAFGRREDLFTGSMMEVGLLGAGLAMGGGARLDLL